MKLAFFMPGAARAVRGGIKVLLTYANLLAARGFAVTVFFPAATARNAAGMEGFVRRLRYHAGRLYPSIYLPDGWIRLHPAVETRWVWRARRSLGSGFDVCIIADHTVGADLLGQPRAEAQHGRSIYLFMEYEYYMAGDVGMRRAIERTMKAADATVAISPAACALAERLNPTGSVHLVCIGIELDRYFVPRDETLPARTRIGFPFRPEVFKRSGDAVAALASLHRRGKLDSYACWAYGIDRRPDLPSWIEYRCKPSSDELRDLLNHSAIFVVPSLLEGWGLPGAEAMACGAALVTTRNGGAEAYAAHLENALLCDPGDVEDLTAAIERLVEDRSLRERLGAAGHRSIQAFTWSAAAEGLVRVVAQIA
jgi:glycosyltransferase involved in cell wall biosynthesis